MVYIYQNNEYELTVTEELNEEIEPLTTIENELLEKHAGKFEIINGECYFGKPLPEKLADIEQLKLQIINLESDELIKTRFRVDIDDMKTLLENIDLRTFLLEEDSPAIFDIIQEYKRATA